MSQLPISSADSTARRKVSYPWVLPSRNSSIIRRVPFCFAVADHQLLPDPVIARGPTAPLPPLLERFASRQRAGLALQRLEVVLQIENLLKPAVAAFMAGDALSVVPNLDVTCVDFCLDFKAYSYRNRIEVGSDLDHFRYMDADLALKNKALAKMRPINGKAGRYKPSDRLLSFRKSM